MLRSELQTYMPSTLISALTPFLEREIRVPDDVPSLAASYRTARPFPHIVIDGMFSPPVLDALIAEMPDARSPQWRKHDTKGLEKKLGMRSAVSLQKAGFELTAFLHSAAFLYFLTEITGIAELLPDPYLQGGGFSMIPPGGFFKVHVDRNIAYETGLLRRLALIVYLNKSWRPEYGGQLELWNQDGTRREVVVEPTFNRTILFEVAEGNYHGVPMPVSCPPGDSRNSFLVYYHTASKAIDIVPHTSIFAGHRHDVTRGTLRAQVKDWMPPILFRTLKRVVKGAG